MDWEAIIRGAGQGATMGWGDEAAASILASIPQSDGTDIPREYAGGQYEQYRDESRADNAAARERAPWQYGGGSIAGGLPLAVATSPLGGGATGAARVAASGLQGGALGGIAGAGDSNKTGRGLARDAAMGAAIGGAIGTGASAAGEGLKAARNLALRQLTPELAPAGAGASGGAPQRELTDQIGIVNDMPPRPDTPLPATDIPKAPRAVRARKTTLAHKSGNEADAFVPEYDTSGRNLLDDASAGTKTVRPVRGKAAQAAAPAAPALPLGKRLQKAAFDLAGGQTRTRVRIADVRKQFPELSKEEFDQALMQMQKEGDSVLYRIDDPTDITPADAEHALSVAGFPRHIMYLENAPGAGGASLAEAAEKELQPLVQSRAQQGLTDIAKRKDLSFAERQAMAKQAGVLPTVRTAPQKPLVGPKQLPDERVLELARAQREAAGPLAPQGAQAATAEQMTQAKGLFANEIQDAAKSGNVVQLDDGALQEAVNPIVASRVRELQQNVKQAEAAGDPDIAESLRDQIETLLGAE